MRFIHASKLVFKHVMLVIFSTRIITCLLVHGHGKDPSFTNATNGVNNNNSLVTDGTTRGQGIRPTLTQFKKSATVERSRDNQQITTLVLLQVLHRHGDRSPTLSYPNDPHKDAWPQGLGQLSQTGMTQGYEFGQFLLSNYNSFLGSELHSSRIYIRSTDYDRTLMTAECVAAGLFSGRENETDQELLNKWRPVPIHSVPVKTDRLLRPSYACQYIKDLRDAGASTRQMIFDQEDMLYLSRVTGMEINVTNLQDLAEVVSSEKRYKLKSPDWLTKEMEEKLIAYNLEKELVTPDEAKYLVGTLFDTLMNKMRHTIMNPSDPVKVNLFSAHESTVRFLKALLGVDNQKEVPYIGAIIIELHHFHNDHYIRFLYRNSSDQSPQTLLVNHCDNEFCHFSVFQKAYQDLMFSDEDWNKVCQSHSSQILSIQENMVPILAAVFVVCLALVMYLGYRLYIMIHQSRHKLNLDQYTLLETEPDAADSDKEFVMEDLSRLLANSESGEDLKESVISQ